MRAPRNNAPSSTRPDVTNDIRSPDAIRAAFARELPPSPVDPTSPPPLPSPEARAATKAFTLFVWACVDALFDPKPAPRPRLFDEWTAEQRALLTEIARVGPMALVNRGDLSARLVSIGALDIAPGDPRYLDRYVGLVAPSVLERRVGDRPLWLWLRMRLMNEVTGEALADATAELDESARIELSRLAVTNCYQLMRRWPRPEITPSQEQEDAASLFDVLLPVLSALDDPSLERALAAEVASEHPESALVCLFAFMRVERGLSLHPSVDAPLADAAMFYPTHARKLLAACPADRRAAIVSRMEPVAHNARGFWTYVDLLEPEDRAARVIAALASFTRACIPEVARRVKELVRGFPSDARERLRAITKGPNAALVAEALSQPVG